MRILALVGVLMAVQGAPAAEPERLVASILPALAYGPSCSSVVEVRNLGERAVTVAVEGHRASGALAGLAGRSGNSVKLAAGERGEYKLDIAEETTGAWVKIVERVPSPKMGPVLAVGATTECVVANQLRTVRRDVAFPMRNPWFSSDVAELHGGVISLINTSEQVVKASACYSAGGLYSVPSPGPRPAELKPICSASFEVQIPPFGSREFPVDRDGSSQFSLRTDGDAVVLEMLRPLEANVKVYLVDSSIRFEGEVGAGKR